MNKEDGKVLKAWLERVRTRERTTLGHVETRGFTTREHLTAAQAREAAFEPYPAGRAWEGEWVYGWFRYEIAAPAAAAGRRLVLMPRVNERDGLVFVNGEPRQNINRGRKLEEVLLSRAAGEGERFEVLMEVSQLGKSRIEDAPLAVIEEDVRQLRLDAAALLHCLDFLAPESLRRARIEEVLCRAARGIDFDADLATFRQQVAGTRGLLAPLLASANPEDAPTFFAFGHGHLDVAWLWPLSETRRKIARTLASQLRRIEDFPEHVFLQPQPALYRMLQEHYPELFEQVVRAVEAGGILADGGMWVEADTNMSGGEALIRQFMHGRRYFRETFGKDSRFLWLPDVFGYSAALPQIASGCGITCFATAKIFWNDRGTVPFPWDSFHWEGLDGTRLLTHLVKSYNSSTDPKALHSAWIGRQVQNEIGVQLLPFGHGDGGAGPDAEHLEMARRARDLEGCPRLRLADPTAFFAELRRHAETLPVYVGELYLQMHQGTLTSQAAIKRGNRRAELALREAECWTTAAALFRAASLPRERLSRAWETLLTCQFHDILPGTSIAPAMAEAREMLDRVARDASEAVAVALRELAGEGAALTLFNSLSWERRVLTHLPEGWRGAADAAGRPLPVHPGAGADASVAEVVLPPMGWTSLSRAEPGPPPASTAEATARGLENEWLRVTINPRGEIESLLDKQSGRDWAAGTCNRLRMYIDDPFFWEAWDLDTRYRDRELALDQPADITVLREAGPEARVRVARRIGRSTLTQEIVLRRDSRRVDFETEIDWRERRRLLKVDFPVSVRAAEALHEIQFGHLPRPTHASTPADRDRFEVCNYRWTALAEEGRGCAVLNDCKYGVDVRGSCISLSLLRAPTDPDPESDRGRHRFTYSFHAWNGSFWDSDLVRQGCELNAPPLRVENTGGGSGSLLDVDAPNVIVETVKPAEDGANDLVFRLYEAKRTATRCSLTFGFPVAGAAATDLKEEDPRRLSCRDNRVVVDLRPFEILTLKVTPASQAIHVGAEVPASR